ncbi:MAG: hypothetical protein ABH851_02215 [Methanobacteriota archaeon]
MHKESSRLEGGGDHHGRLFERSRDLAKEVESLRPGEDGIETGDCLVSLVNNLLSMGLEDSATELLDAFDGLLGSLSPAQRFGKISGAARMATQMIDEFGDGRPEDCRLFVRGEIVKLRRKPGERSPR